MLSLCKLKTLIAFLLTAILSGVLLLVVYPIYSASSIHWPKVDSYEELLDGCDQLLEHYTEGTDVPKNAWPEALLRIEPRYVFIEDGYINIVISTGGIGDSWGLIVTSKDIDTVPTYAVRTENPRIFRYK